MSFTKPSNRFLRLCSRAQSRQLDTDTINTFGIDGTVLMEIAGLKASDIIRQNTGKTKHGIFICGKGNNAGDALVIARYLVDQANHSAKIILTKGEDNLSDDMKLNLNLLKKLAETNSQIHFFDSVDDVNLDNADYLIDGMIGTGLSSDVREPYKNCIKKINLSDTPVYSLDIPTGLDCDTGSVLGSCIQADVTISFGTNKIGFYLNDGPEVTGKIYVADLPFPEYMRQHRAVLINEDLQSEQMVSIQKFDHKYQRGAAHIIAGSKGMTGAAMMSAKSAWQAGSGAVFLYTPQQLLPIYETALPQIIKVPVGNSDDDHFKPAHLDSILDSVNSKKGSLLIGPGLGLNRDSQQLVIDVLKNISIPVILDADALSVWDKCKKMDKNKWILTPHIGELRKSIGLTFGEDASRLDVVEKLANDHKTTILSKGYPSIIATYTDHTYLTGYDTRCFSRAGFGDVLSGTIAGKIAVNNSIVSSAIEAMVEGYQKIKENTDPEPRDIYDW